MTDNDKVPELGRQEFEDFTREGLALVDFSAEWCMPCLTMAPVIDELSEKFRGKIKFAKINIDENQEIAQRFNIRSIPNFVLFKNGDVADQFTGAMSLEEFEDRLKKHL